MSDVVDITLDTILARLREIDATIKAHGVTRLAVFGSRARGDARPDSDLDVLVDTTSRSEANAQATHGGADRRRSGRGVLNAA